MTTQELIAEAKKLPLIERYALADELYATDDEEDDDFEITPEFAAELERRYQESVAHPEDGISWEDLKAELLGKKSLPSKASSKALRKKTSAKRSTGMKMSKSA